MQGNIASFSSSNHLVLRLVHELKLLLVVLRIKERTFGVSFNHGLEWNVFFDIGGGKFPKDAKFGHRMIFDLPIWTV